MAEQGRSAAFRFSNTLRYRDEEHPNQTALTPPYVLSLIRRDLGGSIGLDPCTTPANPTGAERFYCPPSDGVALPWDASTIYVNPPYGRAKERWTARCVQAGREGRKVVLLIPAHPDTRAFQAAAATAAAIVFVRGRVKFGEFGEIRPNGRQVAASHGSAILSWNVDLCATAALGVLMRPGGSESAQTVPGHAGIPPGGAGAVSGDRGAAGAVLRGGLPSAAGTQGGARPCQ